MKSAILCSTLMFGFVLAMSDDTFAGEPVTLAAIAVGVAPEQYAQSEAAQKGLAGIRKYLAMNPPPTLHHKAMVLWAASYLDGIVADEVKSAWINDLQALQKDDGGWGLATLGDWKRADGKQQDKESSDGYGTGFVIYVLRRAGVPATSERFQRGIQWLKNHQRESGRWFTRSLNKDNKHFLTHAGTSMAVLALTACDAIPSASSASAKLNSSF